MGPKVPAGYPPEWARVSAQPSQENRQKTVQEEATGRTKAAHVVPQPSATDTASRKTLSAASSTKKREQRKVMSPGTRMKESFALGLSAASPPGSDKSLRQIGQKFMPWLTSWTSATMCTVTAVAIRRPSLHLTRRRSQFKNTPTRFIFRKAIQKQTQKRTARHGGLPSPNPASGRLSRDKNGADPLTTLSLSPHSIDLA